MDMRNSMRIAEGLFGFGKKPAPAATTKPSAHPSLSATMVARDGIRWHKESDPAERKVIWHGAFTIGDGKAARVFTLAVQTVNLNGEWRFSLGTKEMGFVVGTHAVVAAEKAVLGLLRVCENLKPSAVTVSASGNLLPFMSTTIRQESSKFSKAGYAFNGQGALVRTAGR